MRTARNIRLLELFTIGTNMSLVIPVVVPYYRDRMGLTFHDFLIGEAAFAIVMVLLEVPTGWLSDVWRRKSVLALAAGVNIFGYACLLVGDNLMWAVAGQAILGVGVSLVSGTNTAMLYDTLLSAGRTDDFRRLEGRRAGLGFYSVAGASIAGGFLYPVDPRLPVIVSMVTLALAGVAALMMQEPSRHKKRPEKHPIADMAVTAKYALRHPDVGAVIFIAAALFCATKLVMWSQQPYYMAMNLPESVFGVLMACGFLLAGASSQLGHRLDGKVDNRYILGMAYVAIIVLCLGAGAHLGWSGVALLMLGGSGIYGMVSPRVSDIVNAKVGSERRATILSTQNLLVSLFFIPVSYGVGWVSDIHGIGGGLLAVAGWLGGTGLLALVVRRFYSPPP